MDYEEELSALYGPYLQRQTEFLYHSIRRILRCYKNLRKNQPTSVIAIGHSMGGLLIRGLFTLPKFKTNMISTIITLATPHLHPPLKLDYELDSYYKKVNQYWLTNSIALLKNITFLSLAGGFRDFLVRSDLCFMHVALENSDLFSTAVKNIPTIRLETDHQCIVWCNELVRMLTRAFFKMIDYHTIQITTDPNKRSKVISELFFHEPIKAGSNVIYENCRMLQLKSKLLQQRVDGQMCMQLDFLENSSSKYFIKVSTSVLDWLYSCKGKENCRRMKYQVLRSSEKLLFALVQSVSGSEIILNLNSGDNFLIQKIENKELFKMRYSIFQGAKQIFRAIDSHVAVIDISGISEKWHTSEIQVQNFLGPKKLDVTTYIPWSRETFVEKVTKQHKFILKFFHQQSVQSFNSKEQIQLTVISENSDMHFEIQVSPFYESIIGQLIRFSIEELLSYVLVFTFMQNLYNAACLYNRWENYVLIIMANVLKILIYQNHLPVTFLWKRFIIPNLVLLVLIISLSPFVNMTFQVLLIILQGLVYPVSLVIRYAFHRTSYSTFMNLRFYLVLPLMVLFQLITNISAEILILIHFMVHVTLVNNVPNKQLKKNQLNMLITVTPIILQSVAVPLIVYTKDVLNGFPLETYMNWYLYFFSLSYSFYLIFRFPYISYNSIYSLCRCFLLVSIMCYIHLVPLYFYIVVFVMFLLLVI